MENFSSILVYWQELQGAEIRTLGPVPSIRTKNKNSWGVNIPKTLNRARTVHARCDNSPKVTVPRVGTHQGVCGGAQRSRSAPHIHVLVCICSNHGGAVSSLLYATPPPQ